MKTKSDHNQEKISTMPLVETYTIVCVHHRNNEHRRKRSMAIITDEQKELHPDSRRFASHVIVPLHFEQSDDRLWEKLIAVGGKWDPTEKLWFVKYGNIAGTALEHHISINPGRRGDN